MRGIVSFMNFIEILNFMTWHYIMVDWYNFNALKSNEAIKRLSHKSINLCHYSLH